MDLQKHHKDGTEDSHTPCTQLPLKLTLRNEGASVKTKMLTL